MAWFNRKTADDRTLDMLYDFISCFDSLPRKQDQPPSVECCFFKNTVEPEPEARYLKWRHARDQYREQELWRIEAVEKADRMEEERLRALEPPLPEEELQRQLREFRRTFQKETLPALVNGYQTFLNQEIEQKSRS